MKHNTDEEQRGIKHNTDKVKQGSNKTQIKMENRYQTQHRYEQAGIKVGTDLGQTGIKHNTYEE